MQARIKETDLFDDMVHLFAGRQVARQFKSDISVVLHPLSKVPLTICYWRPNEGLGSSLNLFFDRIADRNLGIGSISQVTVLAAAGAVNLESTGVGQASAMATSHLSGRCKRMAPVCRSAYAINMANAVSGM